MHKQNGGLKKKHPEKKGFKPVFDMINSPSANITLLTYKSLKGFMIRLDVSEEDSEYLALSGSRFTKLVTSFILKFAVIAKENDTDLPMYKDVEKSSESKNSFFDEAKLQQEIWIKSILGDRPQICPSVANFSLFDNDNSKLIINFLKQKHIDGRAGEIFNYLLDCLNITPVREPKYGIGILVMPNIENSMQLGDFLNLTVTPNPFDFYGKMIGPQDIPSACSNVLSQIVRLFLMGVIHFDLHSGNVLIYLSRKQQIKSFIIDFGRVSNIMNGIEDEYLTIDEKNELKKKVEDNFNELTSLSSDAREVDKIYFIQNIIDDISDLDKKKNQAIFTYSSPDKYQMKWYLDYVTNNFPRVRETKVLIEAFDKLKRDFTTEGTRLLPTTIQEYKRNDYLPNFDLGVDSFVNTFSSLQPQSQSSSSSSAASLSSSSNSLSQSSSSPYTSSSSNSSSPSSSDSYQDCDEEFGMCAISGGKNKKTKRTKTKKTRKTKTRRNIKTRRTRK